MKKKNTLFILFISLLLFPSCFDIVEEVNFNKDNSGHFKFYFQFKDAQILQQQANTDVANTINDVRFINNYDGIKNFEYIVNHEKYQFGIQFDFNNLSVLNLALQHVFKTKGTNYFAAQDNQIIRYEHNNIAENIEQSLGQNKSLFNFNDLFADVKYNTQYTFENIIDSTKNKNSKINNNIVNNTIFLVDKEKHTISKTLADTIFIHQ